VVAVGAVTAVPLGDLVTARRASDVAEKVETILRTRDATYEWPEIPIELTIGDRTFLLPGGFPDVDDYHVMIRHGFYRGTPGTDECLAIACRGQCSHVAANASAILLGVDGIEMAQW
jgi:hypothetical protein